MPLIVELQSTSSGDVGVAAGSVITADIPELYNCPILTRIKAFVVPQGGVPVLEHVFRDPKTGNPIDLSDLIDDLDTSESSSESGSNAIKVRIREPMGRSAPSPRDPIFELTGTARDVAAGTVRATLEAEITAIAGIYEMVWAIVNSDGQTLLIDRSLLSVERSLFTPNTLALRKNLGPPSLQELRMLMMDSSRNENLLLDDVEFGNEQLLLAITKPVEYWNEQPPNLKRRYTTRDFPLRNAWVNGILGQLYIMAAAHYRRNLLKHSAAGTAINDKDKEREYRAEGLRLWQEYQQFVSLKKVELNLYKFAGGNSSEYALRSGW